MAEGDDSGDREELPTQKRLDDARKKGQVPRSKELGIVGVMLAGALGLIVFGPMIISTVTRIAISNWSLDRRNAVDEGFMLLSLKSMTEELTVALLPFMALLLVVVIVLSGLLGGFVFSREQLIPKMSNMSVVKGIKRMLGPQAWMELLKSILKVLLVGLGAYLVVMTSLTTVMDLPWMNPTEAMVRGMEMTAWGALFIVLSLFVVVAVDVPFQIWKHTKELKMTKQEIKDEYKETEGKPEVKSRIRQMQQQIAQGRMMERIAEADVVITNPTHFAVALSYDLNGEGAPILVAKGADFIAEQIKKVAKAHEVPIIESPLLARSIYHTTELEKEIPEGLYVAVAQVLAYVFQLVDWRKGKAKKPVLAKNLPVPEELRY